MGALARELPVIKKPPMLTRLWKYGVPPPYYANQNNPAAVVLHIAAGWRSTAEQWAANAHFGASWHYFVCLDGTILYQLQHEHGGYHAGISQFRQDGRMNPPPTWTLWRGWNANVNNYTLGIEHEGFGPFTPQQAEASRWLCKWLAQELSIPYERDWFPSHAEIALIDRPNDYGIRLDREAHYRFMFEEEEDQLKDSERTFLRIAGGDFRTADITYNALDARGFFDTLNVSDGHVGVVGDGENDVNDAILRRMRFLWLATSDRADEAYEVIQ